MTSPIPTRMRTTIIWTALGLGGEGLFTVWAAHVDLPVITAAWAAMFVRLAKQADVAMDKDTALKIVAGVLVGIGGLASGIKLANTWLSYTGVGTIPAMVCNAGTNGVMTYIIGTAAARVFLAADRNTTIKEMIKAIIRFVRPGHHGHA